MKTIKFEQVEPAFHKWAGIFENNQFEHWELINSAWLEGKVRFLPHSKIKFASARIKYDMIDYMRRRDGCRRRKSRETIGKKYKHLPYMINFSDVKSFYRSEIGSENSSFESLQENPQMDILEQKELVDFIINSIFMTRTEKLIMKLYYIDGLLQEEIGKVCGYEESRISQIRRGVIERLKTKDYSKVI